MIAAMCGRSDAANLFYKLELNLNDVIKPFELDVDEVQQYELDAEEFAKKSSDYEEASAQYKEDDEHWNKENSKL